MNFDGIAKIEKALEARAEVLKLAHTDCFRLFDGSSEGIPGLVIEQFGRLIIFQVFEGECHLSEEQMLGIGEWILKKRGATSIYRKLFIQDRSKKAAGAEHYSRLPFVGVPAEEAVMCKENGIVFEIHPFSGFSTGLFLDQRNNRAWLASQSQNQNVLNLFSYTCGFSVACAAQAARTTSVDLSKKYLEWGKKNFEHNQLNLENHRFVAQDVFSFLKNASKKKLQFEVVIADPPSFSRTQEGKVFSLKKDLNKLLEAVLPVVAPRGVLFFSCNLSEWNSTRLFKKAKEVLVSQGHWEQVRTPQAPQDFLISGSSVSQFAVIKQS